jgi:hypothetical protein
MNRSVLRLVPLFAVILLATLPLRAWAPQTRVRMADEAVRFLPAALRLALETQREPLLRGMLAPQVDEDSPSHRPSWAGGTLEQQIDAEARRLAELLRKPRPFSEIAEAFGRLAHYVMDAGFPPGVGEGGGSRYAHFAAFCEERREKFPLVFYGHEQADLERGDYAAFAAAVASRARADDRQLALSYAKAGDPPDPSHFDDRSVPFAVGSLSYSHTVNDVVRVWLAVWDRAGGDMGRTPYKQPASVNAN